MTDNEQLTPPLELVEQWSPSIAVDRKTVENWQVLATHAAQWGYEQRGAVNEAELQKARDEELEGCCEWLVVDAGHDIAGRLYAARRPKPATLKEQALEALDEEHADMRIQNYKLIRAALERLRELEEGNG